MMLDGKVAIVTGGGQGIGFATARLLAAEGARVTVAGRDAAKGDAAAASIRAAGGESLYVQTDVGRGADVEAMTAATVEAFGGVDILINNAGLDTDKTLLETTEEDWDYVLDANLKGHFLCAKAAVPHMLRRGGGSIVNTASVLALWSTPGFASYCASKAGVMALTRSMVLEWGPLGIRVNCILPGSTDTDMMWRYVAGDLAEARAREERITPAGRVADPSEIAQASLWLCSPAASFAMGSFLVLDGGALAGPLSSRSESPAPDDPP